MNVDFEKILREELSPETFQLISTDEKAFKNWVVNLKDAAEMCGELAVRLEKMI